MFSGMGGGRSSLRMLRLAALVVFLLLVFGLHAKGSTYNAIHIFYIVVIVGLLVASFASRRRGGSRPGGSAGGGGRFGAGPPTTAHMPPPAPTTLPDNPDPEAEP
jgi:hypothetical protein